MENLELKKYIEDFLFTFKDNLENNYEDESEHFITVTENDLRIDPNLKQINIELNKLGFNLTNQPEYGRLTWKINNLK